MKLVLLLAVAVVAVAGQTLDRTAPAVDFEIIDYVNSGNFGWKAGVNDKFVGYTLGDLQDRFLGAVPSDEKPYLPTIEYFNVAVPDEFDGTKEWGKCYHGIRDQGHCGSCWAFGSTESLQDRFCIQSGGAVDVVLSPQDQVSCDRGNYGCQGGYMDRAWNYLVDTGVVSDECYPYTSGKSQQTGTCQSSCTGSGEWKKFKGKNGRHVSSNSIAEEVFQYGPCEVAFTVYQDFIQYKSGVYRHVSGGVLGGHAVELVGWGTEDGTPYWLIANSWGTSWGANGFFKIMRGKNECGIESQVYTADASL